MVVFETGYNTGIQAKELVEKAGFHNVRLLKDYAGIDRILMGVKETGE